MSNYGTMQSEIADQLSRSSSLASQIRTQIQNSIKWYENDRFWFNETEWTIFTVENQDKYALPSNYQEADILTYTIQGDRDPLRRQTYEWYRWNHVNLNTRANRPTDWTIYADQLWLYPTPDSAYLLTLSGQKSLGALVDDGDTNAWMVEAEEMIRCRTKGYLFRHVIKDAKQAADMDVAEDRAFSNITSKTTRRNATGMVRPTQF